MILSANNDEDREIARRSVVLLDGEEQDITDVRRIETGDAGSIEFMEKPARLVVVMGERALATITRRGRVEVRPR